MSGLQQIYEFLERNRSWNQGFQARCDNDILGGLDGGKEQVIRVLHSVSMTQAAPRLNNLSEFWKKVHAFPEDDFSSICDFVAALSYGSRSEADLWGQLFVALRKQKGWGDKTSALLVKSFIRIAKSGREGKFWKSCPVDDEYLSASTLYVPVDAVIKEVFKHVDGGSAQSFDEINQILKIHGAKGADFLLWDDLWFWGFITQVGGAQRELDWNEAKYWCLWGAPKDKKSVDDVKKLAGEFVAILKDLAKSKAEVSGADV